MKIAIASLQSSSPYSQSKNIDREKFPEKPKESKDAYEQRTWRERMHVNESGFVEIPETAFANAIKMAARRLQLQVPGKGKTQYTKYFEAGIIMGGPLVLNVKPADVAKDRLFVPSDGKPGGGKRVYRNFPRIDAWEGKVTTYIVDDIITEEIFTQVFRSAGLLVGIGRFRPENRGFYGRFRVTDLVWTEDGDAALNAAE